MILFVLTCVLSAAVVVAIIVSERRERAAKRNMRRWRRCVGYMIGVLEEPPSDLPKRGGDPWATRSRKASAGGTL